MRPLLNILGVIVLLALGLGGWYAMNNARLFSYVCHSDGDIDASKRDAFERGAQSFLERLDDNDIEGARAAMTRAGSDATTDETMQQLVQTVHEARHTERRTGHIFSLFAIGSESAEKVYCGETGDGRAYVERGRAFNSGFVTLIESLPHSERTWTFFLEQERGAWRVRAFHVGLSNLLGRSGCDYWRLAQQEQVAGRNFNATLFYDLAGQLIDRGTFYQAPEMEDFLAAREHFVRHPDLPGPPPFVLHLGGQQFRVKASRIFMTAGDGSLIYFVELDTAPAGREQAAARNHVFIDAMNSYRPEWSQRFDALVAGSSTGETTIWRTVYNGDSGYVDEGVPPRANAPTPASP